MRINDFTLEYDEPLMEVLQAVSKRGLASILNAITKPPTRFYLRVNTLKANVDDVLGLLRSSGLDFRRDEELEYAIWYPVKGPFKVDEHDKVVVADVRSAESVFIGSDLYSPGVLKADGVKAGDAVTIKSPNGVPVGEGVALVDGKSMRRREGVAVRVTRSVYVTPKVRELKGFADGLLYSQSAPSMWAIEIARDFISSAKLIVDFNAAPGGKVTLAAQLARKDAKIIAIDRKSKEPKLMETIRRLGLENMIEVVGGDSRYASELAGVREKADVVLIDPPCTNLGVVPKIFDVKKLNDAVTLAKYQAQFVKEALRVLRKGGILIYSTCTLTDVENEGVVEEALSSGFEVLEPSRVPRYAEFNGLGVRFSPEDGVPGFFVSTMVRKR